MENGAARKRQYSRPSSTLPIRMPLDQSVIDAGAVRFRPMMLTDAASDLNCPPNCPPTGVFLVFKVNFFAKIFAL
jgi:hypothetical protein